MTSIKVTLNLVVCIFVIGGTYPCFAKTELKKVNELSEDDRICLDLIKSCFKSIAEMKKFKLKKSCLEVAVSLDPKSSKRVLAWKQEVFTRPFTVLTADPFLGGGFMWKIALGKGPSEFVDIHCYPNAQEIRFIGDFSGPLSDNSQKKFTAFVRKKGKVIQWW